MALSSSAASLSFNAPWKMRDASEMGRDGRKTQAGAWRSSNAYSGGISRAEVGDDAVIKWYEKRKAMV
jgi:hypothetical protein